MASMECPNYYTYLVFDDRLYFFSMEIDNHSEILSVTSSNENADFNIVSSNIQTKLLSLDLKILNLSNYEGSI